jgi:hypothetical protein
VAEVQRKNVAGREVILADLSGTGTYQKLAAAKAAPANPHAGQGLPGLPALGKNKLPFRFQTPDGWQPLRALPQFAIEAFQVADGRDKATVTISSVGGSVAENVVRWRGQLQLPAVRAEDIAKDLRPMKAAGLDGTYVDLTNPRASDPAKNRILGVILPAQGTNWIVKMTGPDELVGRQKANFEAFVESFQPARD